MPKEITAEPSVVVKPDGSEARLDSLPELEKTRLVKQMTAEAGKRLSEYYTRNQSEWADFAKEA